LFISKYLEALENTVGKNQSISIYQAKLLKNPAKKIRRNTMIYITPNVNRPLGIPKT
jgi:hypothetical protein